MRLDWRHAVDHACPYCLAGPGEGCWVLQGNRPRIAARDAAGEPRAVHVLRAVVYEPADMRVYCAYCTAGPGEPCRTVPRSYYGTPTVARHPHRWRTGTMSYLAETESGRIHVRDLDAPSRALCGCRVTARPPSTVSVQFGRPVDQVTCGDCRRLAAHFARLGRPGYEPRPQRLVT